MTAPEPTHAEQVAQQIEALRECIERQPVRSAPVVWEGAEPDEYDGWSARDLDELADRRAGWHYVEGP